MTTDLLASVALAGLALYALVAFVGRTLLHLRRTGSSGWHGISGDRGSAEWWGGVLVAIGGVGLVVGPIVVAALPGEPTGWLRASAGAAVFVVGTLVTVVAQLHMGDAWRIGVGAGEATELRTTGSFRMCRNPIFTGSLIAGLAVVVWVPLAAPGWLALLAGLELQVRLVEEPHLLAVHGAQYRRYSARTGRFVPGMGRQLGVTHEGAPGHSG